MQKEVGNRFNLQTTRTQWIYLILEVMIELMFIKMTERKLRCNIGSNFRPSGLWV